MILKNSTQQCLFIDGTEDEYMLVLEVRIIVENSIINIEEYV